MEAIGSIFNSIWLFIRDTCPAILEGLITPFNQLFESLELGWFGSIIGWLLDTVGIGSATPLTLMLGVSIAIFIVRPIVSGFVSIFT